MLLIFFFFIIPIWVVLWYFFLIEIHQNSSLLSERCFFMWRFQKFCFDFGFKNFVNFLLSDQWTTLWRFIILIFLFIISYYQPNIASCIRRHCLLSMWYIKSHLFYIHIFMKFIRLNFFVEGRSQKCFTWIRLHVICGRFDKSFTS